jgi:hypothetical protein
MISWGRGMRGSGSVCTRQRNDFFDVQEKESITHPVTRTVPAVIVSFFVVAGICDEEKRLR